MNVMHMEYMQEALGRIKSKMAINAQMNLGYEWDYALLYPRVQGLVTTVYPITTVHISFLGC